MTCSTNGGEGNIRRLLLRNPEGTRQLGRARSRRVDNTKIDLRETVRCDMDWIDLAQDRDLWKALVNMVKNFRIA
jgi:hypothetical protein